MLGVIFAMPIVCPLFRLLLEYILAVWTEDIIAEAEVLEKHYGSFGDLLIAILILLLVWPMYFGVFFECH
jgi:hypothetical protein